MADVYKGLKIELGANAKGLTKALNEVKSQANAAQKELKQIEKALKFNPKNGDLLTRQLQLMEKRIQATTQELNRLNIAKKQALDGKINLSSEQWTKLYSDIAIAENKLANFNKQLETTKIQAAAAQSVLGRMGNAISSWGKYTDTIGRGMQTVGRGLTHTLTPAVIAAGAAAVATAVDIDTSLTNVKKTVDGTEEQYQALKQAAIEFSKSNAVSATEILDIQSLGAQLGFAIEELDEFSRVVSGLDIATNMDAEQAATELAQFANITKMAHDEASNYGSAIVDLGNNMATTESDISSMAMRIAAAGTQVGMSQADILGFAAALSSMGVEAEAGGTAISTIMAQIDKDVARASVSFDDLAASGMEVEEIENVLESSQQALETWANAAGMSADQFAQAWKDNPAQALADLLSGMEAAVDEGGNMSLMLEDLGIQSIRQTDIMKRLAGNSQLVTDAVQLANSAWEENTALQAEVDNRNESLAAKFEMLKNRLVAIAEQVGGPLADALLDIVDAAEPLISAIEDGARAFSEMSKEEQQAYLMAAGVAAAFGPMLTIMGKGVSSISSLGRGMQTLAEFLARMGGAGKTAASELTAVGNAGKAAEGGVKKFSVAMGALKTSLIGLGVAAAVATIAILVDEFNRFQQNAANYKQATDGLKDAFGNLWGEIKQTSDAIDSIDASKATQTLADVRGEVEQGIEAQAKFAESLGQVFTEANTKAQGLKQYYDIIDNLYGKTDLTARQQEQLKLALEKVGEATGTAFELIQNSEGAYVAMANGAEIAKDAILQLIEAQQMQYRLDAVSSQMEEAFKNRADRAKEAADATKAYNDALEEQSEWESTTSKYSLDYNTQLGLREAKLKQLEEEMNKANATYEEADAVVQKLTNTELGFYTALDQNASAITRAVMANEILAQSLQEPGQSALDLSYDLEHAGVTAEQFSSLSTAAISALAASYDGTFGSIEGVLKSYGVNIDEAKLATMGVADAIEQELNQLPDSVREAAEQVSVSLSDLAFALADAGVPLEDFANLTDSQMAAVVWAFQNGTDQAIATMEEFSGKTYEKGSEAAQNWYDGFNAQTQAAAAAAAEMTQQTLDEFWASVPEYAQVSEESALEYINGILNGGDGSAGAELAETEAQGAADAGAWEEAGSAAGDEYESGLQDGAGEGGEQLAQTNYDAVEAKTPEYNTAGTEAGQQYMDGITSTDSTQASKVPEESLSTIESYDDQFNTDGQTQGQQYCDGLTGVDAEGAGAEIAQAADSGARSVDGTGAGENFGAGFVAGIRNYIGDAIAAATEMVNAAKSAADAAAQSHSPSRVMMERGEWFTQGFAIGIENETDLAEDNAVFMVEATVDAAQDAIDEGDPQGMGEDFDKDLAHGIELEAETVAEATEAVAQAILEDSGLVDAFEEAGLSAEAFARDLLSLGYTMDEIQKQVESFTAEVSNGFSSMVKDNRTSFTEWQSNLKGNITAAQEYAENLKSVMAAIPSDVESVAFRREVWEGGFEKWGQVIKDMASMTEEEIAQAVELYNQAVAAGEQSIIDQFDAIAPDSTIAGMITEGLENADMDGPAGTLAENTAQAVESKSSRLQEAGGVLAESVGTGFDEKAEEVADGVKSSAEKITNSVADAVEGSEQAVYDTQADWTAAGSAIDDWMAQGIMDNMGAVLAAVDAVGAAALAEAEAWVAQINATLASAGSGEAVSSSGTEAFDAGRDAMFAALSGMAGAADIHSPSGVTEYYGQMLGQGLVNGIESSTPDMVAASEQSAYEALKPWYKATGKTIKYLDSSHGLLGQLAKQFDTGKLGYELPMTGAVFESMKMLENAEYTLDSFKDALESAEEEMGEWTTKLIEAEEAGEDLSDSEQANYEEFLAEYNKLQNLKNSLTATIDEMEAGQSLYMFDDELISSLESSLTWSKALTSLYKKTGVAFSQGFVEYVMANADDYEQAIQDMAKMSKREIQNIVDAYDDMQRAQRETELAGRRLWVNSLKTLRKNGPNVKDVLLDFEEKVLDVTEVIYSNDGLADAFEAAGYSADEFAGHLTYLDMDMDTFASAMENYTSMVSNGFDRMSTSGQTSLSRWMSNLRKNSKESAHFTENLEAVMNAIPDTVDAQRFRQAVMEGGYEQFGKIIKQLAKRTPEQIAEAIELFNQTYVQANADTLAQLDALGMGKDYVEGIVDGATSNSDKVNSTVYDMFQEAATAAESTYTDFYNAGAYVASGVAEGMKSQTSAMQQALSGALSSTASGAGSPLTKDFITKLTQNYSTVSADVGSLKGISLSQVRSSQSAPVYNTQSSVSNTWNISVRNDADYQNLVREINNTTDRYAKATGVYR